MSLIENWPIPVNECYGDVSPLERIAYRVVAPITSGLPTILELSRGGSNLMPSAATSADSSLYLQVSDAFPWDYNGAWMALTSGTKLGRMRSNRRWAQAAWARCTVRVIHA